MSEGDREVVVPLKTGRVAIGLSDQTAGHLPTGLDELRCRNLLEALPAAIYATDATGRVTFYNRAAVEISGRQPRLGSDQWCVSWRLFWPDGRPMPHEECPMAVALREQRPVRGQEIIVQRPDGTRVFALPYPTPLHDANGSLIGAVNILIDITERKQMEQDLHRLAADLEQRVEQRTRELARTIAKLEESERTSRLLIQGVVDYSIFLLDPEGRVTTWNTGAERIKGYTREEIQGKHFSVFYTEKDRVAGVPVRALATARATGRFEAEGWRVRKDGTRFWASVVIDAIHDESGALLGFAKITRDLTERKAVEERLRQAQKMEAIGQLTGGIAHDFNNLLTVIMGGLERLDRIVTTGEEPEAGRAQRAIETALEGARRAGSLTQRLLAFSRQQALEPKVVEVDGLVAGMSELLRRTLGEAIKIETKLGAGGVRVLVDANQFENALLNLAVNARDAMAEGGRLTITTADFWFDKPSGARYGVDAGGYVKVTVSDTGCGMDQPTLERAFDPFFTTKPLGQGTGLGLSMVYGFVKQSGGSVQIQSEPGAGTTVTVYLPRLSADAALGILGAGADVEADIVPGGSDHVLVVEDDDAVRAHSTEALRELGYRVLEACDAEEALRLLEEHREIALLFSDIGLPGTMNGRQLSDEARRRHPALKVLLTTGYARDRVLNTGRLDPGVALLRKPFGFAELSAKVREVLAP